MAVFRGEKTGDYTVMSNYHLRDSGGARELEAHGYLVRVRVRNENGQLGAIEHTILELPKEPAQKPVPVRENPIQVKVERVMSVLLPQEARMTAAPRSNR